jgi:hypothetical protein
VPRLTTLALAIAIAIGCCIVSPAWAAAPQSCGEADYSYAGLQGSRKSHGVRATLTPLGFPQVVAGHVAAWVGVGWAGGGPKGQDEWIQVGMASETTYAAPRLYYEIVKPGAPYRYVELGDVAAGRSHRLAVLEMEGHEGSWRVWVDGKVVSEPVYLPGSHGTWEPVATAESWNGGVGACNQLAFRFEKVGWARRAGGSWSRLSRGYPFADPGYRVVRRAAATFLTLSRILAG